MTYKQINQAHEVRMWIKEVGIPFATVIVLLASNDDVRRVAANHFEKDHKRVKNFVNKIIKKDKKSKKSDIIDCDFYVVR